MATRGKKTVTVKQVQEQIIPQYGNVQAIADALGCTRRTVYTRIKEGNLQAELDEARESMIDLAENVLVELLTDKQNPAQRAQIATFVCKTRGKTRGYVERQEIAHEGVITIGVPEL